MAILQSNIIKAKNKADGKGEIQIEHLLSANELYGKCDMYAKVTIPPGCSIGYHEHHGNAESYHILQGEALYSDNGREMKLHTGATAFCPDGEGHSIENSQPAGDLIFMALITKS